MKKVVILRATGSELANQLWNYASIYAYALERGLKLQNPSFFEYGNYFTMPAPSLFFKLFFFLPFTNYTKRKSSFKRRLWRKIYNYYARCIISANKTAVLISDNKENHPFYLPPTKENENISRLEKSAGTVYFDGWLFRNPAGLQKYRNEITEYFKPRADIRNRAASHIKNLRALYQTIIGVHIRQGDYKTWRGGKYFIPQTRVREIMDEFIDKNGLDKEKICFAITSDNPVDESIFAGLNIFVSKDNAVHDLFLLVSTDAIIGSNSTFGAFASYYGNIPFVVMQKEEMDWEYYTGKNKFFENKYSTFVSY